MVIIDTSVIIEHLRLSPGKPSTLIKLVKRYDRKELSLSVITVAELYAGKSSADPVKEQALLTTIAPFSVLPYTYEISVLAGKIIRDSKVAIAYADAAIAATVIAHQAELATLNRKDFAVIAGLVLTD